MRAGAPADAFGNVASSLGGTVAKVAKPVFGRAVANLAKEMADLASACLGGEETACDALSQEDEAKRAWMAKQKGGEGKS